MQAGNGAASRNFSLGIDGFTFHDLFQPARLAALDQAFRAQVKARDAALSARFESYRAGASLSPVDESNLLVDVAPQLGDFVGELFRVQAQRDKLFARAADERALGRVRAFVMRRCARLKKDEKAEPLGATRGILSFISAALGLGAIAGDEELTSLRLVAAASELEEALAASVRAAKPVPLTDAQKQNLKKLREAAKGHVWFAGADNDEALAKAVALRCELWLKSCLHTEEGRQATRGWSTLKIPQPMNYDKLVHSIRPDPAFPQKHYGPEEHLRRRDGFKLTDKRYSEREVGYEVDYCILCHDRDKDSCSKGLKDASGFKSNKVGISLEGCPLEEKISEMHALRRQGDSIGALALICIDNPMCPGTGHRICNDCMKSCIYQTQDPVNIPQAETGALIDVLRMDYGVEIYGLLTRFNPLNRKRPFALPYNGLKTLVVGMGPAGYTLSHHLMNEGFGVAAIDGLKIEPPPADITGHDGKGIRAIKRYEEIEQELDKRIFTGFGGVSEYGITVRWDKNFLYLLQITLMRRDALALFGGTRFGGTVSIDDAWELGFDHIAIATGAGKPTIINIKNNLCRGIRKASDFLMALQLTGASKRDNLSNLQVRLPALVIGGGLTGIDTATELLAYYPVQVEKHIERYETLCRENGKTSVDSWLQGEDKEILAEFQAHYAEIKAERARAKAAGEQPDFVKLVRKWGGVTLCYRKGMKDAPAYRLNHEEIIKALEEGIGFAEHLSPLEAIVDGNGALKEVIFAVQGTKPDGKFGDIGERKTLACRSLMVAAGTSPNVIYEREHAGTFKMDADNSFYQAHTAKLEGGKVTLTPAEGGRAEGAFFTSYLDDQGRTISIYGDNHPLYEGNVVKAMASAKDGFGHVAALFKPRLAGLDTSSKAQAARDAEWVALKAKLDEQLRPKVHKVVRLTPTIVEVIVKAPMAARHFEPGQFYRLQNFETFAPVVDGTRLATEGLALTGAWVDKKAGLLSTIVLEMGGSSRLMAALKPGEPVVLMGPTGTPTEIPKGETVCLFGGGLGNAVLFSIAQAMKNAGNKVLYFAGYKKPQDLYKQDEVERSTDQVIWSVDVAPGIKPRRKQDLTFVGNIVQSFCNYAEGKLGERLFDTKKIDRIIAIGSDRMMAAVKDARHGVMKPFLKEGHVAIGSINSTMQCMMKEICAQCLQKHVDPVTGKETAPVFSCFNQDQELDKVDFANLNSRLRINSLQEKITNMWLDRLLKHPQGKMIELV